MTDSPQEEGGIPLRAYDLWLRRGCPLGSPEIDWLDAEREVLDRLRELEITAYANLS